MEINTLDLIIISGITISVIYSLIRGLIKEIFSLLSIIIGIFIATRYYTVSAKLFNGLLDNQNWANVAGFVLTLVLVSFCVSLVGMMIQKLIKEINLGIIDRIGGAIFGLLKGIIISFFIIMLLIAFFPPQSHFLKTSKVTPQIIRISTVMVYFIPKDLKIKFMEQLVQLKDLWLKKYEENKSEQAHDKKISDESKKPEANQITLQKDPGSLKEINNE